MSLKLHNSTTVTFIPDGTETETALARTTHLGIGAHQDDLEIMAYHGILACFDSPDKWFSGVTCTNGSGSARIGPYADYTDEAMMAVRREEQRQAAILGRYGAMIQLDHPSSVVKNPANPALQNDLVQILRATKPDVVYTHNPADKHATHIGIVIPTLLALRQLPVGERPSHVYGCEVWRDLDWLPDEDKVALDVSGRENMAAALVGLFDSQIAGGKRYDLATIGRRHANATYFGSHAVDEATQLTFALDLTPLVQDESLDIVAYVLDFIDKFREDVRANLSRQLGRE
ncbi:MAG: PIG-L family deacetylase [Ardenticatenaceae bacterium]|nr:PIG-L family deacetylase [Ardenticatenaceae bacterium]MCB9445037.1 PIG-L family deacetylase [Ardenticatenaceae bacterium]